MGAELKKKERKRLFAGAREIAWAKIHLKLLLFSRAAVERKS